MIIKQRRLILKATAAMATFAAMPKTSIANSNLAPIINLILDEGDNNPSPVLDDWLDDVGLLEAPEFQAMISSEALDRPVEIWVDAQRSFTGNEDGSFENPFNHLGFLGSRDLSDQSWVRSSIAIVPKATIVRLKGSFNYSDHIQGSHSTRLQIHYNGMSDGFGGVNLFSGEPLIFAPWPGESSYKFDVQGQAYPYPSGKESEASPIFLLGSGNRFVDVAFYGLEITGSAAPLALHAFEGTRTLKLINCHIHDNAPPSTAQYGNGGVGIHASLVNGTYLIDHCLFENNSGLITNNVGDINLKSVVSTDVDLNKLEIKNSIFSGGHIAVTGKHSGNSTVETFHNYFCGYRSVFYARGNVWNFHHNIIETISHGIAYPDYQFFHNAASIIFDHNTCINSNRVLESTNDQPDSPLTGTISWGFTNNVFWDSDFSDLSFHGQTEYSDGSQVPTNFQHSNNLYGFGSNASILFYESNANGLSEPRSFVQAMAEFNDSTSAMVSPDIDLTTFKPIENGNCDGTGTLNSNIGAL